MKRILIANRGEIALKLARACRRAGLESVAVYSAADAASPHIWAADEAIEIGPPAATASYLHQDTLLHVAKATGCDAVHPGYGFLSENATFAERCADQGLVFVGPPADVIRLMGDKARARDTAKQHGVPVVPGSAAAFTDRARAEAAATEIGYPLLLKARAGGGGRGMRVARAAGAFAGLFDQARGEAEAAFSDGGIYLERFFPKVRHVEVQVFADSHGTARHVWERDCSVQRRHQKVVEEGPSPALAPTIRDRLCEAARRLTEGVGYVNAGTVEFIFVDETAEFFFIEMNTRIQVEHPVTEAITGLDLIHEQLRVADGQRLSFSDGPPAPTGHAFEFRINAEDPARDFMPRPGRLTAFRPPAGPGVHCETHAHPGYEVTPFYDSMIAKLIVHGSDRDHAIARARDALDGFEVAGPPTTAPFHRALLDEPDFRAGQVHTRWIEEVFLAPRAA